MFILEVLLVGLLVFTLAHIKMTYSHDFADKILD